MRWVGGDYGVKTEAVSFSEMRQRSKRDETELSGSPDMHQ